MNPFSADFGDTSIAFAILGLSSHTSVSHQGGGGICKTKPVLLPQPLYQLPAVLQPLDVHGLGLTSLPVLPAGSFICHRRSPAPQPL